VDPTCEIDRILEALGFEVLHYIKAAHPMVAQDDQWCVSWYCFVALWDLAHWDVECAFDATNSQLGVLPHVEKDCVFVVIPQNNRFGCTDFLVHCRIFMMMGE